MSLTLATLCGATPVWRRAKHGGELGLKLSLLWMFCSARFTQPEKCVCSKCRALGPDPMEGGTQEAWDWWSTSPPGSEHLGHLWREKGKDRLLQWQRQSAESSLPTGNRMMRPCWSLANSVHVESQIRELRRKLPPLGPAFFSFYDY